MRSVIAFFCALLLLAVPAQAQTAEAQAFIAKNITIAFGMLQDTGAPPAARAQKLEAHLLTLTDLPRVAAFTLGSAQASPAQREAFGTAFRDYALATWRAQFQMFQGGAMTVTGARENAPGDVVVRTALRDSSAAVIPVDFRVRIDGPHPLIIDIGLAGIWLTVTQRDDFAAVLARNGGDVDALTATLSARTRGLR